MNKTNSEIASLRILEPCEKINQLEIVTPFILAKSTQLGNITSCSTAVVNGLSQQIIDEMNLISPNALVRFDNLNVRLGAAVWPFLQRSAQVALEKAIQERGTMMKINSAYRTIAQQLILFNHAKRGRCRITIAAPPGKSNHQSGLALDINDAQGWKPFLKRHGWHWFGSRDPVHFDYVGGGTKDIRSLAILAFQKLWNKNNPQDRILEDGIYGPQVQRCLNQSPINGFGKRILRLTRPLMMGDDVRKIQQALVNAGFVITVDGFYGKDTVEIVKQFQQREGLTVDGVVGAITRAKLLG